MHRKNAGISMGGKSLELPNTGKKMSTQLCFDFYKPATALPQRRLRDEFCRCMVKWFLENRHPDGYGVDVATRVTNIKTDAAFFWSKPKKNSEGPNQLLAPCRTAVVICSVSLDQCWVNCGDYEQVLGKLVAKRRELDRLEAQIRREEPHLRDGAALFEEYAVWNYVKSANKEYQKARAMYNQMEKSLYHGSRFDRIASAKVADELYLAVPAGLINSEQVFQQWGILEIKPNREVKLVREPSLQTTSLEARSHLVQNIAIANSSAVSFSLGLRYSDKEDRYTITRRPRRSRREETGNLE